MGYFEHLSDIDKEISSCYEQIEALQNRIKTLKAKKEKEERLEKLCIEMSKNKN